MAGDEKRAGHALVLATMWSGHPLGVRFPPSPLERMVVRMKVKLKLHKPKVVVTKRDVGKRWTPNLAKGGFTPIVSVFLENYAKMSPPLTTPEAMLIIQLMSFKWDEAMPWPAFKTLAKRMGISDTAVRNHARNLETRKKYIVRHKRVGLPNLFDLTPLFAELEKVQTANELKKKAKTSQAKQKSA